jgi:hypothetical protein
MRKAQHVKMKKLYLISTIALLAIFVIYFWTAMSARKKSNEILAKFNEVNNEIKSANDSITPQQRISAAQKNLPVGMMNSQIILLIDSLREQYENSDIFREKKLAPQLERDIRRLLRYIREVNEFKWMAVDSRIPDTIKYWPNASPFNENEWLSSFFRGQPKEVTITYLNYLKNEAIANND